MLDNKFDILEQRLNSQNTKREKTDWVDEPNLIVDEPNLIVDESDTVPDLVEFDVELPNVISENDILDDTLGWRPLGVYSR